MILHIKKSQKKKLPSSNHNKALIIEVRWQLLLQGETERGVKKETEHSLGITKNPYSCGRNNGQNIHEYI